MTWISFRNFHINLAAKPAKLSMPPPYTEYQSDCVCVCVCAWTKIRSAGKEGGGRLVSYVVACELSQRPKGCTLRVVESCNCSQTERESKNKKEKEQEQERGRASKASQKQDRVVQSCCGYEHPFCSFHMLGMRTLTLEGVCPAPLPLSMAAPAQARLINRAK